MGLIKIGRVIRQHGVRGGMKIKSDFKYKKDAFKVGNVLKINNRDYKLTAYSFAGGGQLDIAYLEGINTIDDVIKIKQNDIYIDKSILNTNEILDEELLGMDVYLNNDLLGTVTDINTGINPLIIINKDGKNIYIPRQKEYINNIDVDNNRIDVSENVGGML